MSKLRTRLFVTLRRLGEYELLRKIGSGGMAEVWMGRRAAMAGASKVVAIKLLARNVLDDPAYRQMFLEEARLSMLLTNSNVVQVFDVGESGDECYMVMEWVDGLNLSELRRKMSHGSEQMSTVAAAHVVGEVLRALAYAHGLHHDGKQATIVHRDVSPQNVLVSVSGEVKLADFGVARLAHEETSGLHVKGKLRYMAPEQLRGRSRAPTVDLYAVGAILHELLSGQRFRSTRDEADLYSMVLSGEYDKLSGELPDTLVQLTYGLLEPDPSKRIPSADLALELLYSWPGYRNSSLELSRVVQRWLGVSGPRSGFLSSEMVAVANSAAETRPADTRPRSSSPPPKSAPKSTPSSGPAKAKAASGPADPSELDTAVEEVTERELDEGEGEGAQGESGPSIARNAETHTFVEAGDATTVLPETEVELEAAGEAPPPRGDRMSMLLVAGATLAISFGVFGIGFPLGWWGGGSQAKTSGTTTVIVNTSGGTETGAPPLDLPAASETSETETAVQDETSETGVGLDDAGGSETGESETGEGETGETGVELSETGDDEGDTADDGGTTGGPKTIRPPTKKVRKPVEVTFNVGNFTFVYVRVDRNGKELALEPSKTTKVMSGRHTVYFREFNDKTWTKAGTIRLEPGRSYRVEMRKPKSLKLIEK